MNQLLEAQSAILGANRDRLVLPPELKKRGLRLKLWAGAALIALAAAWVTLASSRSEPVAFRTVSLSRRDITRLVEASGQVDVLTRTEVPAPAAGTLVESLVQSGAAVREGQELARLDSRAATITLRASRAALRSASSREAETRAALAAARDVMNRTERLAARGLSSASEVGAAQADAGRVGAALAAARAEREVASQNLAAAELQRTLRTIVAPAAGVVLTAPSSLGMIAAPERGPLFVIGSQLESIRVDAWISESEVGVVSPGQGATFTVPAYPDRRFDARVVSVSVDATRTGASVRYLVRLLAPNADLRLLPGMTATVRIEVGRVQSVLAVPEAALRFAPPDAGEAPPRSRVFRLRNGQPEAILVEPGLSDGAQTELRLKQPNAAAIGDAIVVGRMLDSRTPARGPGISLGRR